VKVFLYDNPSVHFPIRPQKTSGPIPGQVGQSPSQNRTGCRVGVGSVNLPSVGCKSQDIQPLSWLDIGLVA